MMPICDSYLAEANFQYRTVAIQGMGIVFMGNFSGMVAGLALSPPLSINVPKTIGGSLFGGFIGMAITYVLRTRFANGRASLNALTLILKKTGDRL